MTDTCSVSGCNKPLLARGLCNKHYTRLKNHGDVNYTEIPRGEPLKWFNWARVTESDECMIWPFSTNRGGYPSLWWQGKLRRGHRVMCEQVQGPAPFGYAAAHSCGVPRCINPRHLSWKTYKENSADQVAHGTVMRGERNWGSKLTLEQVLSIRVEGGTHEAIASRYGVCRENVTAIKNRKAWKWA